MRHFGLNIIFCVYYAILYGKLVIAVGLLIVKVPQIDTQRHATFRFLGDVSFDQRFSRQALLTFNINLYLFEHKTESFKTELKMETKWNVLKHQIFLTAYFPFRELSVCRQILFLINFILSIQQIIIYIFCLLPTVSKSFIIKEVRKREKS